MRISGSSFVSPRPLCQPSRRFGDWKGRKELRRKGRALDRDHDPGYLVGICNGIPQGEAVGQAADDGSGVCIAGSWYPPHDSAGMDGIS